jgi:hypothetical protein
MRRVLVGLLAVVALGAACLIATMTASAFTSKAKSSHSITLCYGGKALGRPNDGAGPIAAGSSLVLKSGWGPATEPEVSDFLNAQSGTGTIFDSTGAAVKTVSWLQKSTQYWTGPSQANLQAGNGQPVVKGWSTSMYVPVGSFPSGSYTVTVDIPPATAVSDGFYSYGPGTLYPTPLNVTNCQITVTESSQGAPDSVQAPAPPPRSLDVRARRSRRLP